MLIFKSFQAKLVLFFVSLLVLVQVAAFLAVYTVTRRNVLEQIKDQLLHAEVIFERQIEERAKILSQESKILAADFGFREAIAYEDRGTVLSALRNLGHRIKGDRVLLISLENSIIADTHPSENTPSLFPFPGMIQTAEERDEAVAVAVMDRHIYEFVVIPVMAPIPIAWIGVGLKIDDALAGDLKERSVVALDISFAHQDESKEWRLLATTLEPGLRGRLSALLPSISDLTLHPETVRLHNDDYVTLFAPLKTPEVSPRVGAILQYSLDVAMQPYRPMLFWLLVVSLAGLALSVFGGVLIARGVTRPVRVLSTAAGRMEQGDYSQPVDVPQRDEIGRLASAFNHMMAGIAEREEKISYQALHDTLTGLPNRVQFEARLKKMIAETESREGVFSVILVGIDRFSEINYTLGHGIGDRLIQTIGARLRSAVQQSDTIARLASDNFILLLPDAEAGAAPSIAERVLKTFEEPFSLDDINVDVSACLGISSFPAHGQSVEVLMQRADVAMTAARQSSGLYAVYDIRKDPYNRHRLSLMGELKKAIDADELRLFYQPKVDIASGRTTHVETLVRWMHPSHGFLPPDEFIPLAEQTGHIHKLTLWALRKAIRQCCLWREKGMALKPAVNLSAKDLLNRRLPNIIAGLLVEHGAQPSWLVLEITESAIMQDPDNALGILEALRAMGLTLSIDDFGTGYSSLSYLKKFPVHELKIDKSFVMELAGNHEDEIIVRSAIDLGHNMGLKVIAEGVEDQRSLDVLKRLGCDMAQGYLISRPLPLEDFHAWLETSPWGAPRVSKNNVVDLKRGA